VIDIAKITDVTNHLQGIQAVIFDLDDTLYSEKEYVRSGYRQVARCVPSVERAEEKLWQFFLDKKPAIDELLTTEGIFDDATRAACVRAFRSQMPDDLHFYEGVDAMLTSLREQGYRLGIITDGRVEAQSAKIKALGLEQRVDKIIITDSLGGVEYRKPCPKSYMLMKEAFQTEYAEMVYVGDNLKKDFIACEQLGIRAIHLVNPDGLYYCP
jgi:putative hydrolase of the HAD superfamily